MRTQTWTIVKQALQYSWPTNMLAAGASPLSPLIKSMIRDAEPAAMSHRGRASVMRRIEARLRFLAVSTCCSLQCRQSLDAPGVPSPAGCCVWHCTPEPELQQTSRPLRPRPVANADLHRRAGHYSAQPATCWLAHSCQMLPQLSLTHTTPAACLKTATMQLRGGLLPTPAQTI